jgi:hypothetical protein
MVKRWTSLKPQRCVICNAKLGGSQRKDINSPFYPPLVFTIVIHLLIAFLLIDNVSATSIDIVYINASTTAEVYFNNGSNQYYYNETNTLTDDYNTVMITGTIDNNDDLIDNPTIIYDKVLYILAIIFFAFMFLLVVWTVKKVIG